jgi:hypothetical protein
VRTTSQIIREAILFLLFLLLSYGVNVAARNSDFSVQLQRFYWVIYVGFLVVSVFLFIEKTKGKVLSHAKLNMMYSLLGWIVGNMWYLKHHY